jgi:glycerol kinase
VPYILALDEGTTSARAAVYDEQGRRLSLASRRVPTEYPAPGWVEQSAEEIWRAQVMAALEALERLGARPEDIRAIGITNQRETTVVWERATGRPVNPAIVWQCRRTAPLCDELTRSGAAGMITRKTGLVVDPYFSATKLKWILDRLPDGRARARDGELLFGTVDTWLVWKLTSGAVHVTDVTNASRTMLMNLDTGDWDDELLDLFDIPRAMLPQIVPSAGVVGAAAREHLGAEIPIAGIAGDQQAALFGQTCFRAGQAKNTYGTGCFLLLHTGARRPVSRHRLLGTRAASLDAGSQFAIEGSVFAAGVAVDWLVSGLRLFETYQELEEKAARLESNQGVYFVPAFIGMGAPHWDSKARGLITGLTLNAAPDTLARAALEAIAYQTRDLVEAMESDTGERLRELRADGGAAANDFLMQFQADILGVPVLRPKDIETTALGAAYLAGLATGFWKSPEELERFWQLDRVFEPALGADQREELYAGWSRALRQALTRGEAG